MSTTIGFAGMSHLGIVSSVAAASKGFNVIGYDPDQALCDQLNAGQLPIVETGLPELIEANKGRLQFTHNIEILSQCQTVIVSLDIPTGTEGQSDLSPVRQLICEVQAQASPGTPVVVLSQVPPGFTRQIAVTLNSGSGNLGSPLFYQVETLVFGQAVERALHPERLIVGCSDPTAPLPGSYSLLLDAFDCPVLTMRYESAELAKISINMYLTSSVSTTNTMAELCEAIGADWNEIIPALRMDRRIGRYAYLSPGLGISGGNLERDLATVTALAAEHGTDSGVVESWISNSHHRRDWVLNTIHSEVIRHRAEPVIAVWGLAYKQDTDSIKNSPSIALLEHLAPFRVSVFDPVVPASAAPNPHCHGSESEYEACEGADVLVVMTPWAQFSILDPRKIAERMSGRVVLDPYRVLDAKAWSDAGLIYHTLGVAAG